MALLSFAVGLCALFLQVSSSFTPDQELLQHFNLHLAPLPELHHKNAINLCNTLNITKFMHRYQFLYSYIQPDSQAHENHLKVTPFCHVYKWKKCEGAPRAPLSPDCGFFELVQLPQDQCDNKQAPKSTYVNHARAVQLCNIVDEVSKVKATEVKHTPIRVDTEDNSLNDLSDKCVFWKFQACDESKSEGCGQWKMALHPSRECAVFTRPINAATLQRSLDDSPMELFVQETNPDKATEEPAPEFGSELSSLSNLISCEKSGESTTCTVLKHSLRHKRAASHLNTLSRQKRSWCCDFDLHCFPCRRGGRGRGGRYRGCGENWVWT